MTHRRSRDAGTGLIGSIVSLLAVLVMLLFTVQLLTGLYATTLVTSAAHEAARVVARPSVDHADSSSVARARAAAEDRGRHLLGRFGDTVQFDWITTDPDVVSLRVRADRPRFSWFAPVTAFGTIDRTVRVRVETLR